MQIGFTDPWWDTLQLRAQAPFTFRLDQALHWTDYVGAFSTLVAALGAIAVAVFAYVEVRNAKANEALRREAAESRISGEAFALRRQIRSWLRQFPFSEVIGTEITVVPYWEKLIQPHFDAAEERVSLLVERSAEASAGVEQAVLNAYVKFYRATEFVNELLLIHNGLASRRTWETGPPWQRDIDARKAAFEGLYGCIAELNKVIKPELQAAEAADEAANPGAAIL